MTAVFAWNCPNCWARLTAPKESILERKKFFHEENPCYKKRKK